MAFLGQFRGDLRSEWEAKNPVIHDREFILVKEDPDGPWTGYKIGDGVHAFTELPYGSNISILQVIGDSETATMSQKAITEGIRSSVNMINKSDFIKGQDISGEITSHNNFRVCNFFNVHAGKTLTLHYGGNLEGLYLFMIYYKYDKDYTPIGLNSNNDKWFPVKEGFSSLMVDEDAYFIRITLAVSTSSASVSTASPFPDEPDISIENGLKYEPSEEQVIEIAENEIKREDFIDGWDINGSITSAANIIVNEKLFRLGKDKTINIQFSVEQYVWVTLYLYDKDATPISRLDFGGSFYKLLRPIVSNILRIDNEQAYYCRISIINSAFFTGPTAVRALSSNFDIRVFSQKDVRIDEYAEINSFQSPVLIDKQFTIGKFVASNTEVITTSPNVASSLYRYPVNGNNLSVVCSNDLSYFWIDILFYGSEGKISNAGWSYLESGKLKIFDLPEGTSSVIVNLINSDSTTNVNSQLPFPEEFMLKVFSDVLDNDSGSNNTGSYENTIIVAKSGGNYTSINEAVQASKETDVILVYPGIYKETIRGSAKVVNIQGMCRDKCIVQMDTAERNNPPAEFAAGYVANMTFIETGTAATKDIYTASRGTCGYGIHVDFSFESGKSLIIENCNIISYTDPGIGIGLKPNFTLSLRNCYIQQLIDFENHPDTEDIGALYMHESGDLSAGFNQNLEIINCRVYGTGKYSLGLSGDHGSITDRSATVLAINSHFWAKNTGKNSYYSRTTPVPPAISGQNIYLSDQSSGNNLSVLNAE